MLHGQYLWSVLPEAQVLGTVIISILQVRELSYTEGQRLGQGHSTVKWQDQEWIQVWMKQITFSKVEEGGSGFPCGGKSIITGTEAGYSGYRWRTQNDSFLPGACIG